MKIKPETLIIVAIVVIAVLWFLSQASPMPRGPGQRTSVAGTPDKILGAPIVQ